MLYQMISKADRLHPVSRSDLRLALGISDRRIRREIEELRHRGVRVCSHSNGKGYYIAETPAEYEAFRAEYLSRAYKILANVRRMDRAVKGQLRMEVEE